MEALDRCRSILADLVGFPSVSSDSNLPVIAWLAERLSDAGARVEILTDATGIKANLFATLGPDRPGGLMFSGHTDVVPVTDQVWTSDPFVLTEREGRLYGRGACDMKGFLACLMAELDLLKVAAREKPIHFAFTHDEEVGCVGARALAAWLADRDIRPALAIIGEPTGMQVIEGHKGCCEYTVTFTGRSGHSSAPELGVNALEYAARYVGKLLELRNGLIAQEPEGSRYMPPYATLNVGGIEGGLSHNVIAPKAVLKWETRPVTAGDLAYVKREMTAFANEVLLPGMRAVAPEAAIETEIIGEAAALFPRAENAARGLVFALTGETTADVVPFGTEAGFFQEIGMDAVVCGPGSISQAHKPDEFIALSELSRCLAMLERLPEQWTEHWA
ncbi:acetylornithine deacetylase [Martelella endophytica]|uniref:Acetylornithine deacetylase n=1 Tax=Martelella endophytica TaxID=1486262 RepID=A0A0D5LQN7_MAREN|nr:acetylornithine deacetylase [Martelella endophytica]AJY45658.1 acetylornithine deacetylase [Martelella endophytica]